MRYKTKFKVRAKPEEVFAAFHRYKINRNPDEFFLSGFPSKLVEMDFQVTTEHTLGLGAIYDWKIKALRIPILKFKEKVVDWQEGKSVAYQAISGWRMFFRVDLEPEAEGTAVKPQIGFSLGFPFLDWLFCPFIEWGLNKACRKGLRNEGMRNKSSQG